MNKNFDNLQCIPNKKSNKCQYCRLHYTKLYTKFCRLCNMIHNIKPYYINELILCYSDLDQKIIIKKTTEFIKKYKRIPYPDDIDPQVKIAEDPLYKYNNKKHKIFVTNLFKYSYIIKTYFGDGLIDINIYNTKISDSKNYLIDDRLIKLQ